MSRTNGTRVLPNRVEAEAQIIGGIMLRNEALSVVTRLAAEDFYDPRHKTVFGAIRTLEAQSRPIDAVTLEAELERQGRLRVGQRHRIPAGSSR